jgi:hypothetical protein
MSRSTSQESQLGRAQSRCSQAGDCPTEQRAESLAGVNLHVWVVAFTRQRSAVRSRQRPPPQNPCIHCPKPCPARGSPFQATSRWFTLHHSNTYRIMRLCGPRVDQVWTRFGFPTAPWTGSSRRCGLTRWPNIQPGHNRQHGRLPVSCVPAHIRRYGRLNEAPSDVWVHRSC